MNDFMNNWKAMLADFSSGNYADAADKIGGLISTAAQIFKMFGGLKAHELAPKVEQLKAEGHPLFAVQPGTDPNTKFGIEDVVMIVSLIQSVISMFGKWFGK